MTSEPTAVITLLGSCVAVTMFSRERGCGAICHALLPINGNAGEDKKFTYVDSSIAHMLTEFDRVGISRSGIEVKLFGGANVLPSYSDRTVGQANVETAMAIIERAKLNLVASDFGGESGRKIIFSTHTGNVLLKRIKSTIQQTN